MNDSIVKFVNFEATDGRRYYFIEGKENAKIADILKDSGLPEENYISVTAYLVNRRWNITLCHLHRESAGLDLAT